MSLEKCKWIDLVSFNFIYQFYRFYVINVDINEVISKSSDQFMEKLINSKVSVV